MSSWPKWCAKPTVFSVCAGHTSSVNALAFKQGEGLSGRDIIFSGSGDESIRVWDMTSGKCEGELHGHAGYVSSMVLQDEYLVSASYDSTLCLWSANRRTLIKQIKAHEHCVNALMAHESGVLLSASWDGTVRVWDLRVDSTSQTRSYASFLVVPDAALCLASVDHRVYCGLHDASVVELDLRFGKQLRTFTGHSSYVTALTLAKASELLSASSDGSVRLTNVSDGRSRSILGAGASCFALHHHSDGPNRWMLTGHSDGLVKLTNVLSGHSPHAYSAPEQGQVFSLVASTPGLLLTGAADGSIRCWGHPPSRTPAPAPAPAPPPPDPSASPPSPRRPPSSRRPSPPRAGPRQASLGHQRACAPAELENRLARPSKRHAQACPPVAAPCRRGVCPARTVAPHRLWNHHQHKRQRKRAALAGRGAQERLPQGAPRKLGGLERAGTHRPEHGLQPPSEQPAQRAPPSPRRARARREQLEVGAGRRGRRRERARDGRSRGADGCAAACAAQEQSARAPRQGVEASSGAAQRREEPVAECQAHLTGSAS